MKYKMFLSQLQVEATSSFVAFFVDKTSEAPLRNIAQFSKPWENRPLFQSKRWHEAIFLSLCRFLARDVGADEMVVHEQDRLFVIQVNIFVALINSGTGPLEIHEMIAKSPRGLTIL